MYEGWFDEAVLAPGVTGHADWGGKRSDAAIAGASPLSSLGARRAVC